MKATSFALAAICLLAAAHSAQAWSWSLGSFRRSMAEKDVSMLPDYQQCGGLGGACNSTGSKCTDGKWSNVECGKNSKCVRLSDHYHMCEPKVKASTTTTTKDAKPVKKDGMTILPAWYQCGGKTGDCSEFPDGCMDCPFPKSKCAEGSVCYRVTEHFWQCGPEDQYSDQVLTCEAEAPAPGPSMAIASEGMCEAPLEGHAVQGKRFKAITMPADDSNYADCCMECSEDKNCVAFHLNQKSDVEVICALFSEFGDVVEHSSATAGLMIGADIAG